jgi:hypothetical protein
VWISIEGDRKLCDRHDVTFGKKETCPACRTDPGAALEPSEEADADPEALADEKWCRDRRDAITTLAETLSAQRSQLRAAEPPKEPGQEGEERDGWFFWRGEWRAADAKDKDVGYSTVAKLYDTALKFHRAAVEERRARGERNHDRWLVRRARELKQLGVIN